MSAKCAFNFIIYISRTTLAHGSIGKGQNTIEITVIIIDYSNFCECIVFLPAVFLSYRLILKYLFHTIINFYFLGMHILPWSV